MTTRFDENSTIRLDRKQLTLWRTFLAAHATAVGRIDAELREAGLLPLEWYDVLLALEEAPDRRRRMSELAQSVLLSRSGLTRLVDRLERAGLLRREACVTDRRGAYAVLTEAGLAARERTWPTYSEGIARHFSSYLSKEDVEALTNTLLRVTDAEGAFGLKKPGARSL